MNSTSIKFHIEESDTLRFSFATHNPANNSNAAAADSDPQFFLYQLDGSNEEQPLASGTVSRFDSGSLTSFYNASVDLSNLSDFDNRSPLNLVVSAVVSGTESIDSVIIDPEVEKLRARGNL